MELLTDPAAWVAFFTLAALEIVLGIDNIVFISILAGRLPQSQRQQGRLIGLAVALVTRLLLLAAIAWVMGLTRPLFSLLDLSVSWRDVILMVGGLFLIGKSTMEIHDSLEVEGGDDGDDAKRASLLSVVIQIGLLDMVFSLDSVITAVGMADDVAVMVAAIVVAVGVMMLAAKPIGRFVENHPTIKMLALSFLILIGVALIAEGLAFHIPKGYIYFAMGFSLVVEMLNLRVRKVQRQPLKLHHRRPADG